MRRRLDFLQLPFHANRVRRVVALNRVPCAGRVPGPKKFHDVSITNEADEVPGVAFDGLDFRRI